MELSTSKILKSLKCFNENVKSSEISKYSSSKELSCEDIEKIIELLSELLYNGGECVKQIALQFSYILLPIVTKFLDGKNENLKSYQKKCIALSILAQVNIQVSRFSVRYFTSTKKSPFVREDNVPTKKSKQNFEVTNLEIVECCLRFIRSDVDFYRRIWNWDEFIGYYFNQGCEKQKLYSNRIIALLFGMTSYDLSKLNENIPKELMIEAENLNCPDLRVDSDGKINIEKFVDWKFNSEVITDVEGVYLPIFDKENYYYYMKNHETVDNIMRVNSTKINLRSLALGIASGNAICMSGPVGSGKTSLVEYLGQRTGRLAPKITDFIQYMESKFKLENMSPVRKSKRKITLPSEDCLEVQNNLEILTPKNGFLRIQLGDQTDSKVLLGQYRCTDTPGEFVWQPGVLTKAVLNGYWLLLEDLDSATQDVCTVLTNLLENNFLSVPGFRENLKIAPGFQLFVTLRTQKSVNSNNNSTYSLMEKHLYTINILPLSRTELSEIICQNYPKLTTVSKRIVDVFLTFSSGCHSLDVETEENTSNTNKKKFVQTKDDNDGALPYGQHLTPSNLPNSGRMVSTRDLLKLCKRSNPAFQVTSSECAYFVFQNCVDLFCSHLPQGQLKTDLIVSIGARLGIIETRCLHLANELRPEVSVNSEEITVGRSILSRNSKEEHGIEMASKRMKMDNDEVVALLSFQHKIPPPTFSFTRIASCILERISVAVNQNEPVLLVGETGVGKTSSVQYLAYQTNHKLVVVNMNNQSDVSDLIGGFKPVDISYVFAPLRNEFEFLFGKTFDVMKNEKFLTNISVCVNKGNFWVLVRLMLRTISTVFSRFDIVPKTSEIINVIERWHSLKMKLEKLDQQMKNSINLSFAFIPGSLVNCIKNGDWVLLDEINLASTETLECLSTILEPDGSVILLERGDFMPIKRHPDFRIFSCMNPNTDVGKKDLPVGIRNRFTEFFVDELIAENDLLILVGDYLNNTGIQKSRIFNTVQLYMKLKDLSQLELNDGLGNKPVFSLRTLCRALRICAKNLCGSIERNIYESFCLAFLTQLDPVSHELVLNLIQKKLLSDPKKILSQKIPKPDGNQISFEGYWIEEGEKEVAECKEYILTGSVKKNLRDLARIISIGKLPILLQGPTSAGKTSLIEYIAKKSGNYCLRINNHEHTDLQEYIGTYMADVSGKLTFREGVLVKAMRNGYWIILDELNLAPSDILEALNRVLDDNRELYIPETQVTVKAHPNFMLFATQNPPGLYGGRKTLSRAFKNRFIELHFSEIPRAELEIILEQRCLIPKSYAQKMVKTMTTLQMNRRSTTKNNFTLRDLFRWGNRYTFADKRLLENQNYDWNQHLIDEGYLVLSAKVRNTYENEIIADALFQNFRKKIIVANLFSLNENTSMVTRGILEKICNYNGIQNIVWTFEMRRMAVLTSKSLEFNEPVLLVGSTGCGKTTICQILSELADKKLRILNCHMHTEGADFLGGLRPHRDSSDSEKQKQLFEWSDGPLILSMVEGNFFLADEISLAEDSVLERLNCVLESDRTILLAEKGGVDENIVNGATENSEFIIKASNGFQFLATMNPGGDFGKKELSPALRNRFTEIWCTAINSDEDLIKIAKNSLIISDDPPNNEEKELIEKIAKIIIKTVNVLKKNIEKLNFSVRDVLAWVNYISRNYKIGDEKNSILKLNEAFLYGLQTLFLDALEMLPYENFNDIDKIRDLIVKELQASVKDILKVDLKNEKNFMVVESNKNDMKFGIAPFYLDINPSGTIKTNDFSFSAPTTKNNLFRVLSALSLNKAILLEGAPGVGKTSLIENIANAIGYTIVRINLCEHTDLADLFGTDLPAENKAFNFEGESTEEDLRLGSFVWRDGPLLSALRSPNTWILLDELNLAPQSVLEGLNAILDHRGEVYIPELNKTFKLDQETRIFAAQNPLRQGGGRKGLPQSFLNRFTKVFLRKLDKADLLHVIQHNFGELEDVKVLKEFKLLDRMVSFSESLEQGITNMEFGYRGGPFEANLRDILRWCKLLLNNKTGFVMEGLKDDESKFQDFMLVLFEKMKVVYCQRMRAESDVNFILRLFGEAFECDTEALNDVAENVCLYWDDSDVFLSDIQYSRKDASSENQIMSSLHQKKSIILSSQLGILKNVTESVMMEKPIIICGPADCGKTKIIDTFCSIFNKHLSLDTIDDSVTGSFQQFDFNRMLETLWQKVEGLLFRKLVDMAITSKKRKEMMKLFSLWKNYDETIDEKNVFSANESTSNELNSFITRVAAIKSIIEALMKHLDGDLKAEYIKLQAEVSSWQKYLEKSSSILNSGGRFEWVDSVIVKSIKFGNFICLEHVNLASSAILDRLNPILEPNGTLLISEKGVGENNEPETLGKHENFRIFLTMDPKHGEISRAMRNRCIELAITKDCYTEDDLKKIIYHQGVNEIFLIRAIVDIHNGVMSLSNYSNFGVSHLTKLAFLVAQNKSMGLDDSQCLLISALEVYVRSSNVDLLGFGLSYYRNKLREIIVERIQLVKKSNNLVNYDNIILKSDDLTTMSLIKLEAEAFQVVLKCLIEKNDNVKEVLSDISVKFNDLDMKFSSESLQKYLLSFLYQMSSFSDVQMRFLYLQKIISLFSEDSAILKMNESMNEIVKSFSNLGSDDKLYKLPWNSKMLPRLRPYQTMRLTPTDEFKITLFLQLQQTLMEIEVKTSVKQSEINVITYSKAITKKVLTDTIDNSLITGLYRLLSNFETFVKDSLKKKETIQENEFVNLMLSFSWFNRMLILSTEKLYINNSVNSDLLDSLNLHFKWFVKHCVNLMKESNEDDSNETFVKCFQNIQNFLLSHHHPLKLARKIYFKNFTSFLPYYDLNQVDYFQKSLALQDIVSVVPKLDRFYDFEEYQKRMLLMMSANYQNLKKYLSKNSDYLIEGIFDPFNGQWTKEMQNKDILRELIEKYENHVKSETVEVKERILEKMNTKIDEYKEYHKKDITINFKESKFDIELLPVLEYFLVKILPTAVRTKCTINEEYCAEISSINTEDMLLIKLLNDDRFKTVHKIMDYYVSSTDGDESYINLVPTEFYKVFNSLCLQVSREMQRFTHHSLAFNNIHCQTYDMEEYYKANPNSLFLNGPVLTNNILALLISANGQIRGTGLGEINQWKTMLNILKQVLWMNAEINGKQYVLLMNNIEMHMEHSTKLLLEVESVRNKCLSIENENFCDFNSDFWQLIKCLNNINKKVVDEIDNVNPSSDKLWQWSFIANSLCGIVELNLLTYLPIMDPVKKNHLKNKYMHEDVDHLEKLLMSYKFMAITMDYNNLGKSNCLLFEKTIKVLEDKLVKNSKKVAVRPQICIYGNLVKDINHFLSTCCHPNILLELMKEIESALCFEIDYKNIIKNQETCIVKNMLDEMMKKIDLWIINANKFETHTLHSYLSYYRDFISPIECSIATLKNGFIGLRSMLRVKRDAIQVKDSGAYWNVNENEGLLTIMRHLIEFPSTSNIDIFADQNSKDLKVVNIFSVIEKINDNETIYFKLVKAKIQETWNTTAVNGKLTPESFNSFDKILNICNQMWQKQEEMRRKKQEDEDSLYVTKTKCLEEDEEVVKQREISEIFPNYAEEDFDEFLQNDSLEQVIKLDRSISLKKLNEIIAEEDYKFIGDYFNLLMNPKQCEAKDLDYLKVFEDKMKVFHPLFDNYKTCLNNSIDDSSYRSLSLLVGICQENYDVLQLKETKSVNYNFYKDSNITEAIQCVDVMKRLEDRVIVELEQWPDHAVLNDILRILSRIRGFPSNSPLARFNTGLQILRQKVDEWNGVAHKLNNFKLLEIEIAEMVQKWMRMELQCWRESMDVSLNNVRARAYRYWFFLYNLIHEYLIEYNSEYESSLVDFNMVEKRFAGDEVVEEKPTTGKISLASTTKVLKQFIESSNYAEFQLRMKLMKSFENYLTLTCNQNPTKQDDMKLNLIAVFHNLHSYYSQFANQIQEQIDFVRKPVEKKLKDFVKIESFNKDLSYFSMRSNINRVHRHLHKILKDFENEIRMKITDLFKYKDSYSEMNDLQNDASAQQKSLVFDVCVDSFVTPLSLLSDAMSDVNDDSNELINRIEKYFTTSRKLVKKVVVEAPYPALNKNFDIMMNNQLETCTHLRALDVDRTLPRPKQKSQAKHILNQKRKALADFFKTLYSMGISYKTGLLSHSLNPDHIDLKIEPFAIDDLVVEDLMIQNQIKNMNVKLDLYFNKCMFKMKSLTNAMLMPRPDMEHACLERMKGFAIDMFLLIQGQRKSLASNVNSIILLKSSMQNLQKLELTTNDNSFEVQFKKFVIIRECFVKSVEVLEQFKILMKCAPAEADDQHQVLESTNNKFNKNSQLYERIVASTCELLKDIQIGIAEMFKEDSRFKINVNKHLELFLGITGKLGELKELFVVDNEYSVYGAPICSLHVMMRQQKIAIDVLNDEINNKCSAATIDEIIEKVTHSILIAIQNIYKKTTEDSKDQFVKIQTPEEDEDEPELLENHLKEKMHSELIGDIQSLNLNNINSYLSIILDSVYVATSATTNQKLMRLLPLLKQFDLLVQYYFLQQLSSNKLSTKMLSIMLSIFLELTTKGFCVPQDLLSDEEDDKQEGDNKTGEGFGFEDGEGEKDVSNKLESEDQLDEAKKPEDYNNKEDKEDESCKEEKGIDMSEDFDGKMQDVDKNDEEDDSDNNEDEKEEMDKEMGETEEGADKLDDQVWGSDEEEEPEEDKEQKEEEGKGSSEKDDKHNDLGTDQDKSEGAEEEGLDAAENSEENKEKKQQKKDIDKIDDHGDEEEQANPYHNELEEPPLPDEMNLDDDMNMDNDDGHENKDTPDENPFDIDTMKDTMEVPEIDDEEKKEDDAEGDKKDQEPGEDSDDEDESNKNEDSDKFDENQDTNPEEESEIPNPEDEENPQRPDTLTDEEKAEETDDQKKPETSEDYNESKDKQSLEDKVEAMPNQQQKGSHDEVQTEKDDENTKQDAEIDEQDTGEDKDGVGQAENQESKSGHQGVADTKETQSKKNREQDKSQQQKRKKGNTDEERTLGEVDKMEKKTLKTVDKLNRKDIPEEDDGKELDENEETDEYQHVKDAKKNDKTTMDNATEEQSKKIQHDQNAENEEEEMENGDELMETEHDEKMKEDLVDELESGKIDKKTDKPTKNEKTDNDRIENAEEVLIDGENVLTYNVPRGDETSAHCQMDLVNDVSLAEEPTTSEILEMRKMVESEVMSTLQINPEYGDMEQWQEISNRMMPNARELCEQLRLILEPTKCTRLKGDYRTGRRINMRKIIPYIASQFRKDKIWLRRTKAAQRDYKITIAVDDSKSMDHNNSKALTLQAISLVSQALTLLESGKLCVTSFGEAPKIILKYNEQFNGPKMIKALNFDQNQSRIAELLDFSRTMNQDDISSDNGIFEHLLIVLSDGRNIFSEGELKVRNAVKMARLQRMFIVYIIIDNPENKHSVLDIRVPTFSADKKTITMNSYLDSFPFPYYVIVRDLGQLPLVLSDGLRQWFELVNSE